MVALSPCVTVDSETAIVGANSVNGGHNALLSHILHQDLYGLNCSGESVETVETERHAGGSGSIGNTSRYDERYAGGGGSIGNTSRYDGVQLVIRPGMMSVMLEAVVQLVIRPGMMVFNW